VKDKICIFTDNNRYASCKKMAFFLSFTDFKLHIVPMKKLLLLCLLCISFNFSAQVGSSTAVLSTVYNKYLIKINPAITYNTVNTGTYIKKVCAASTVTLNATSGYFEVLTLRRLEQNIIEGKLQKNATPMSDFVYVGEVKLANPGQLSNSAEAE
jgi:hypothetical protein